MDIPIQKKYAAPRIRSAKGTDLHRILELDPQGRTAPICRAIKYGECYIALHDGCVRGFAIINYGFFDNGFVELLILAEEYRRRGIGMALLNHLFARCRTEKLFTSTNLANEPVQKLLSKTGFNICGRIDALDEGVPELLFVKIKPP